MYSVKMWRKQRNQNKTEMRKRKMKNLKKIVRNTEYLYMGVRNVRKNQQGIKIYSNTSFGTL